MTNNNEAVVSETPRENVLYNNYLANFEHIPTFSKDVKSVTDFTASANSKVEVLEHIHECFNVVGKVRIEEVASVNKQEVASIDNVLTLLKNIRMLSKENVAIDSLTKECEEQLKELL